MGIPQIGQDQTGHIGAGDVGDPEELLRQIGHEETEGQAEHCQPLSPGVAEAHTFKDLVHQIANHPGEEEKQPCICQYLDRRGGCILKAGDHRQNDDAQHIIDNGGREDGGPHPCFEMSQFPQGLDGDGYRGGGQDAAHEQCMVKRVGAEAVKSIEGDVQSCTCRKGQQYPTHSHQQGDRAAFDDLVDVGVQPRAEHQQNNAQLGHLRQKI